MRPTVLKVIPKMFITGPYADSLDQRNSLDNSLEIISCPCIFGLIFYWFSSWAIWFRGPICLHLPIFAFVHSVPWRLNELNSITKSFWYNMNLLFVISFVTLRPSLWLLPNIIALIVMDFELIRFVDTEKWS